MPALDPAEARHYLEAGELKPLFLECLGWDLPGSQSPFQAAGYRVSPVAQKGAYLVVVVGPGDDGRIPPTPTRALIAQAIRNSITECLAIFASAGSAQLLWHPIGLPVGWHLAPHRCFTSQVGEGLMQILRQINCWGRSSAETTLPQISAMVALAFRDSRPEFYQHHYALMNHALEEAGLPQETDRRDEFYDQSFLQFQREYMRYPLLTADEELALGRRVQAGGPDGKAAEEELVLHNIRLVVSVARRYRHRGLELLDVIQHGVTGLMRAATDFDPETHGTSFSTYATWWIRQPIARAIADEGRTIRLPVHAHDDLMRLRRAETKLWMDHGYAPTTREVAAVVANEYGRADLDEPKASLLMEMSQSCESLEVVYGGGQPFEDEVDDDVVPDVPDQRLFTPENAVEISSLRVLLSELFDVCNDRQRRVVELRYGLTDGRSKTLEEVGREYGVTRERIRQIESQALKKLRHPSRSRRILDFIEDTVPVRSPAAEARYRSVTVLMAAEREVRRTLVLLGRWGSVRVEVPQFAFNRLRRDTLAARRSQSFAPAARAVPPPSPPPQPGAATDEDDDFIIGAKGSGDIALLDDKGLAAPSPPPPPRTHQTPLDLPGALPLFEPPAPPEPEPEPPPADPITVPAAPEQLPLLQEPPDQPVSGREQTLQLAAEAFRRDGFDVVDLRPKGGCLWVYGGMELGQKMAGLRTVGLRFLHAEHKTAGKWGWWLK